MEGGIAENRREWFRMQLNEEACKRGICRMALPGAAGVVLLRDNLR